MTFFYTKNKYYEDIFLLIETCNIILHGRTINKWIEISTKFIWTDYRRLIFYTKSIACFIIQKECSEIYVKEENDEKRSSNYTICFEKLDRWLLA